MTTRRVSEAIDAAPAEDRAVLMAVRHTVENQQNVLAAADLTGREYAVLEGGRLLDDLRDLKHADDPADRAALRAIFAPK